MGLGWTAKHAWRNNESNTKIYFLKGGTGVCKEEGREGI